MLRLLGGSETLTKWNSTVRDLNHQIKQTSPESGGLMTLSSVRNPRGAVQLRVKLSPPREGLKPKGRAPALPAGYAGVRCTRAWPCEAHGRGGARQTPKMAPNQVRDGKIIRFNGY